MKEALTIFAIVAMMGCTATADRPMRGSEDTLLSQEVRKRLDEADGKLDIREHDDILCRRVRLTGTHMVTRVCYTLAEEKEQAERSQDRIERIMNDTPRPRSGN